MKNLRFYLDLVHLLGFLPRNLSFYRLAFIPKSALQKNPSGNQLNNERLEYLGDAVLDAIVANHLFHLYPEGDEGFLTKLRARIVKRKHMDHLARQIGVHEFINSEISPGSKAKHMYGNALEALIGAIYLDLGYGAARRFFERKLLRKHIDLVQLARKDPDYKSRIIEWAQKNKVEISFESREENLAGTRVPSFVSRIQLNRENKGTGRGDSKKEAEQQAAKVALKSIETS